MRVPITSGRGKFSADSRKGGVMKYGELNLGQIEAIVNKLGGMEGVQRFLRDEVEIVVNKTAESNFTVVIDYGLSLSEMIKLGKYDWVNNDITENHFPVKGVGKKEIVIELVHFNLILNSEDAIKEMTERGLRSATIEELLGLGAAYPDIQRKFPIVAIGSVWQGPDSGDRYVPCLNESASERDLHLSWLDSGWYESWRFAAVRK